MSLDLMYAAMCKHAMQCCLSTRIFQTASLWLPRLVLPANFWLPQTSTCMNGFVNALKTMRLQSGYIIVYVCVYVQWKVLK